MDGGSAEPGKEPPLRVPEMDEFMGKAHLAELCRKLPELGPDLLSLPILRRLQPTVRNEMLDLLEFSRIQPYPVVATLIDDHPRDTAKILPVHRSPAPDARDVRRRLPEGPSHVILGLAVRCLPDRPVEFVPVKPQTVTLRAEVILLPIRRGMNLERDGAPRARARLGHSRVPDPGGAKGTDPRAGIDALATVGACLGLVGLPHFSVPLIEIPTHAEMLFCPKRTCNDRAWRVEGCVHPGGPWHAGNCSLTP